MSRPRGGIIGVNATPAASAINSAASGVWTLREAEALKRAGTWPIAVTVPPGSVLALTFDTGFGDLAQGLTASQTESGPTRSADQKKGGTHSLFVGSTFGSSTTRRIQYGSGAMWDIAKGDFTLQCWVFTTSSTDYRGIISRDNSSSLRHWNLYATSPTEGRVLAFAVFNTTNTIFLEIRDTVALTTNQWVHVAAVRDSNVFRLYKNGVQVASANVSAGSGTIGTASGALTVGALFENGNYCFPGYIDEVLVSTNCLYPNGTTFTPPDSLQ